MSAMRIDGIGTALPKHSMEQSQTAELAASTCCTTSNQHRLLPELYRRTSVQRRGSVLFDRENEPAFFRPADTAVDMGPTTAERMARYEELAPPLGESAARAALANAGVSVSEITDLVTVSCTGFAAPGLDILLMRRLGLSPEVSRTMVGFMGCHGAFNGLRVARGLTAVNPRGHVLVCCVELCSLHLAYGWDPQRIVANALFADGAGAVVCSAGDGPWSLRASGSCVLPACADAMTWRIGDHGFAMTLSAQVPELIKQHLRPWLTAWLGKQGMRLEDVRSWAVHPGGPRVVRSVTEALGIPHDSVAASLDVLAGFGNMSSPTILFILEKLRGQGAGLPCVALGFGPGLTVEGMLWG